MNASTRTSRFGRVALLGAAALTTLAVFAAKPAAFVTQMLVSDGSTPAESADPNLENPWALASAPTGPWIVAANGSAMAVSYDGEGLIQSAPLDVPGQPTGIVYSPGPGFVITSGAASAPARFLFATESGTIRGFHPDVPAPGSTTTILAVDGSAAGALYTGLALATTVSGERLYAVDFRNGKIDVFDSSFARVELPGAFTDSKLPEGFAPYGIANVNGRIVVAYARQNGERTAALAGQGLGIVDVYDTDGRFLARAATRGQLNAPLGIAEAPAGLGDLSGALLVANHGSGEITVYRMSDDMMVFNPAGVLRDEANKVIAIPGIRGIQPANGDAAGPADALYFVAGATEQAGAFGRIRPVL